VLKGKKRRGTVLDKEAYKIRQIPNRIKEHHRPAPSAAQKKKPASFREAGFFVFFF
jgi:hypothetical protein